MERIILHSDMNNFYASVECLYNPSLRGRPLAVTGNIELRHGIVLAKNYQAKKYGVATGDPLWLAKQKCKDIVFVSPNYERYIKFSEIAREIYSEYTDRVEPFGLDECWLDVTGSKSIYGDGKKIADEIRSRIKFELGVTVSVGVSFNKIFAKLGSDIKKPDATTIIDSEHFKEKVWPLPVNTLLYVGKATHNKFKSYGIHTIGDLANSSVQFLNSILGKTGIMLWEFANGLDLSPVSNIGAKSIIKSIGNSTTAPKDLLTDDELKITLYVLCESVSARMREYGFKCRTVQITVRDNELNSYERQGKLDIPNRTAESLFKKAYEIYKSNHAGGKPVRSLAVRACNLIYEENEQLSLMPEVKKLQEQEQLDETIDSLRKRFGHFSIQRGIMLLDKSLSNLDPKNEHIIHPNSFFK